ncbi:MAG: VWA domain-containing protein [Candidatus Micrarchaeaceae archaeon]
MGKVIIDTDRRTVLSNTPVKIVARVHIVPDGSSEKEVQQINRSTKSIILLDNSNSMLGDKLEYAKAAAVQYCKSMRQGDTITIATFSGSVNFLLNDENPFQRSIESIVMNIFVEDDTNMYSALMQVYDKFSYMSVDSLRPASFKLVLLTDGYPTDGSDPEFVEIASKFQKLGIPMYIIGIGTDYNEDLLLEMYHANEIGSLKFLSDMAGLTTLFDNISKQVILYPSRVLKIKLTPGSKLIKIYKYEPQILELDPIRTGDNLYNVPLGNIGTEDQIIFAIVEVPARGVGEFREATFSVELETLTSGSLIVKRSDDLNSVKQSINKEVQAEFTETELKIEGVKALQGKPNSYTRKIQEIMKDSDLVKTLGEEKMKEFVETQKIIEGTKKVTNEEMKTRKDSFTRKRD